LDLVFFVALRAWREARLLPDTDGDGGSPLVDLLVVEEVDGAGFPDGSGGGGPGMCGGGGEMCSKGCYTSGKGRQMAENGSAMCGMERGISLMAGQTNGGRGERKNWLPHWQPNESDSGKASGFLTSLRIA